MKAELIQQSGDIYRPYNVFVGGVCIGEFIPNHKTSIDKLADALDLPHRDSCTCCRCERVREVTSL